MPYYCCNTQLLSFLVVIITNVTQPCENSGSLVLLVGHSACMVGKWRYTANIFQNGCMGWWWLVWQCVHAHLNMSQSPFFLTAYLPTGLTVYLSHWAKHSERHWNMQTQANFSGAPHGRGQRPSCQQKVNQLLVDERGLYESLQTRITGMFCLLICYRWHDCFYFLKTF